MFAVRPYEARTAIWWFSKRGEIDLEPSYQRRGFVWDRVRKAFLIDSMLNDFDLPKLYLADFTYFSSELNEQKKAFAVVDGKQRLSAIFGFFADEFPLAGDFVYRSDPEVSAAGMTYSELRVQHPDLAQKAENFNLPVMSVITDDVLALNELFVRLNSGQPLAPAEVRNAMRGVVPDLVRTLAGHQFFTECVAFPDRRGAHGQAAAKLLLLEYIGRPVDTKRSQLDQLYYDGMRDELASELRDAADRVMSILQIAAQVFTGRDPLLRTQGQLPVYFLVLREIGLAEWLRPRFEMFATLWGQLRRDGGVVISNDFGDGRTLTLYTSLARNPNDARSIYERYAILRRFVLEEKL